MIIILCNFDVPFENLDEPELEVNQYGFKVLLYQ